MMLTAAPAREEYYAGFVASLRRAVGGDYLDALVEELAAMRSWEEGRRHRPPIGAIAAAMSTQLSTLSGASGRPLLVADASQQKTSGSGGFASLLRVPLISDDNNSGEKTDAEEGLYKLNPVGTHILKAPGFNLNP
jgi:hypothetical protein